MTSPRSIVAVVAAVVAATTLFLMGLRINRSVQAEPSPPSAGPDWRQATVRIRTVGCEMMSVGSGFAISPTLIITNRHVVEEADRIQISTWDGRSLSATATALSDDVDLALVRVAGTLNPVTVTSIKPAAGATVTAVGYPSGEAIELRTGRVIDTVSGAPFGESGTIIRSDVLAEPGNSGGPIIDARGRLIGILFAEERATGHTLALTSDSLSMLPSEAALAPPTC